MFYRNKLLSFFLLTTLLSACGGEDYTADLRHAFAAQDPFAEVRVGVNFIPYFSSGNSRATQMGQQPVLDTSTETVQPEYIESLLADAGVKATRQLLSVDLLWSTVEPKENEWIFDAADVVLKEGDADVQHMVTLFSLQFAWPTPPWAKTADEVTLTCDETCQDYVQTVVSRYADSVTYWEVGNEMDKWSAASASAKPLGLDTAFTPEQIASFVEEVADIIHQNDPNSVVITPSISSNDPAVDWLDSFLTALNPDAVDAIGYHSYYSWQRTSAHRKAVQEVIEGAGFQKKPVLLTEAGSSSTSSATTYTNYPNSLETQAADVFRLFLPALAAGDSQVIQHSYQDAPEGQGGAFVGFGLLTQSGSIKPVYYALQLFTKELLPVKSVAPVTVDSKQNIYRITLQDGSTRYVAWGSTSWDVPKKMSEWQSVYSEDGTWELHSTSYGETLQLSDTPVLLK